MRIYSKIATSTDFEKRIKFHSKNLTFFEKNQKNSAGLSKLRSTCPDHHFRVFQIFFLIVNAIGKHRVKNAPFEWMF